MNRDFADTAALFSDAARASMLLALMDGRALPAGELAILGNVAPQTASSHLAKLVSGNVLAVEQQGRHRYYRLASTEVAQTVESLMAITPQPKRQARPQPKPSELTYARTCYSHLAGRLAVAIAESLVQRGLVRRETHSFQLTSPGHAWFTRLGIIMTERQMNDPRFARCCLDWTERKHHIAGKLGSAMLEHFRELKWIAPIRGSRAVRVTLEGEKRLWELLRVNGKGH